MLMLRWKWLYFNMGEKRCNLEMSINDTKLKRVVLSVSESRKETKTMKWQDLLLSLNRENWLSIISYYRQIIP